LHRQARRASAGASKARGRRWYRASGAAGAALDLLYGQIRQRNTYAADHLRRLGRLLLGDVDGTFIWTPALINGNALSSLLSLVVAMSADAKPRLTRTAPGERARTIGGHHRG
jgi:hypothetical protein